MLQSCSNSIIPVIPGNVCEPHPTTFLISSRSKPAKTYCNHLIKEVVLRTVHNNNITPAAFYQDNS